MSCEVRLTSAAVRDIERISPRYIDAVLTFIYGPLAENPRRVGKELRREFAGLHSARRGDYRVLYEIRDSEPPEVLVHRIDHRAHVYRPR
ncbi:type II toxin-antitoxin system RelE/ParE family toxin [Pseudactinotalea sp. HY158]|uniref:type II toxin-antitoxin system RelE family toxin n=1 Tax=Pseudactinotalea sp. HY158 TaxID=2654547 RepID=UPI00129D1EE8|nr:type II toxin-antitoxin system RelE/ParE family toxin [Pseudactinotalea sp. HY158]QGH70373.1 type II toxin-antitoxin system RelE/ParE family toxin [Pseudactinotalea sp. HY158]